VRLALIVNPAASSVTRRARVVIQKALAADHQVAVEETVRKGQAIRLAHGAARAGAEVVIALGGDGTVNEVANGVLGEDCAIAPLPGGSTNVFARAIGYPNDAIEATGLLLEALSARVVTPASVGMANGRAFLFHVGAGFDAAVVARVERRGHLKRYVGHPLFIASTFAAWFRDVERRRPWFSVETADGRVASRAYQAIALNCDPYTFLGSQPLSLAPEASLATPLSVVVLSTLSPRLLPGLGLALWRRRGLPDRRSTRHWSGVERLWVKGYRPFPYQLDGELMDPVTELELSHHPGALRLITPQPDSPA
jgi:diacylglycerol kinase family enzyme